MAFSGLMLESSVDSNPRLDNHALKQKKNDGI